MTPFRHTDPPHERTPEERERERAERAARRAAAGRPTYDEPVERAPAEAMAVPDAIASPEPVVEHAELVEPVRGPPEPRHEPVVEHAVEPEAMAPPEPEPEYEPEPIPEPVAEHAYEAEPEPPLAPPEHAYEAEPEPPMAPPEHAYEAEPEPMAPPEHAYEAEPEPMAPPEPAYEAEPEPVAPLEPEPIAPPEPEPITPPGPLLEEPEPHERVIPQMPSVGGHPERTVPPEPTVPLEPTVASEPTVPSGRASPGRRTVSSGERLPRFRDPRTVTRSSASASPDGGVSSARPPGARPRFDPSRLAHLQRGGRRTGAGGARPVGLSSAPEHHRGRRRRRLLALIPLVVVLALLWFLISLFQPLKGAAGHSRVDVTIPAGAGASKVGSILAADHVVSSGFFFSLRAAIDGKRGDLRSGHFVLARDMSYGDAITALTQRPPPPQIIKVTIPEGRTRRQITALARADGVRGSYLSASARSPLLAPGHYGAPAHTNTLEGFLFPATYDLPVAAPATRLVAEQLQAFKRAFGTVSLSYARHKHLTSYDVLTIASMVEGEAQVARDRPLIAAVIYNRLHDRMPLGIDATLRFGLNYYNGALTVSQLRNPSPYNTRLHRGLPPTPIGNPGLPSLIAAAHPAHVPYLYFVVKAGGCGEHVFSSSFAQFQRDAARYATARATRGGTSPTRSCGR